MLYDLPLESRSKTGIDFMAEQINRCVGPSGSNREYVIELARALRSMGYSDHHVFEVESWVLTRFYQ